MMDAYIYRADIYCETCAAPNLHPRRVLCGDSDCCPQGPYADGGGEADSPQHCGRCGTALDNPLTEWGLDHFEEMR